ncbi:WD40 repeat-like protein [Calocera cornea HHB12733]|uniref:WD40 repeat-like protein n=1 Tax=Calocera cornea HHB12733 TaxID=1353952 RepID=A0A165FQB1_9BASI|nr:WD40 repeat-like protein [Calocera cornea HHB12733]
MQRPPMLKTAYRKSRVVGPLHTGGPIALTADGGRLITVVGEEARLTAVQSGETVATFRGDTSAVTALCVSGSGRHLCVFYASLALRIYELPHAASLSAGPASSSSSAPQPINPIRSIARAHDAPVHVCRTDPTSTLLASGSADGVVKVWDVLQGYVTHNFRGHGGVVSALCFNFPSMTLDGAEISAGTDEGGRVRQLITGSVDTRVRVFDLQASAASAGEGKSKRAHELLEGHVSAVRGLDVSRDGRWLVSGGRDGVALIWDISGTHPLSSSTTSSTSPQQKKRKKRAAQLIKTLPLSASCEALGVLLSSEEVRGAGTGREHEGRLRLWATGGASVGVWDASEGRVLLQMGGGGGEDREVVEAIYNPSTGTIVTLHADQNIVFHSLATGLPARQLVGYNDSIVDAVFLSPPIPATSSISLPSPEHSATPDSHLAIATNSSLIRVYSTESNDARLLQGHGDMVLALARSADGGLLASGGKDRGVRVWALASPSGAESVGVGEGAGRGVGEAAAGVQPQEAEWRCVALCEGHTESVGALALSRTPPTAGAGFMLTGSQDRTIKLWDLSTLAAGGSGSGWPAEPLRPKSLATLKAHEKDINALDIAPSDRLAASASQDKTIKVYEIEYAPGIGKGKKGAKGGATGDLRLVGTCRGHKKGVWTVRFGRNDRVLASGSADKTVRLWSLDDFSCLKTFEGHTNSVLRVDFLSAGMQLVSTASDGLVKLWNVKEEECVTSLDNHDDRVWALAISQDESTIVSAGADSVITFWEDCTEEQELEREQHRIDEVAHEQDFLNYVSLKDYRSAIVLALAMDQPKRLLTLFTTINAARGEGNRSITGSPEVDQVVKTLGAADLVRLLKHVRDWNATARTSPIAQLILHAVLKLRTADDIAAAFSSQMRDEPELAEGDQEEEDRPRRKPEVSLRELIDGLLPYTERHYARAERLVQDSYVVDHVLGQMDDWLFDDGDAMVA